MYSKDFRRLALRKIFEIGIANASRVMHVHRTTLWRWKTTSSAINKKSKEDRINKLFAQVKDFINNFISTHPFVPLYKLRRDLESIRKISKTTLSKYVKKLGYSRKRARKRGVCKNNALEILTSKFIERFDDAILKGHTFVCIDECGFSEILRPIYGFAKRGEP